MDNEQQRCYLNELSVQCQFAVDAYDDVQRLSSIIRNKRKKHTAKDSCDLFRHLHSLFTHTGNVSKLLYNRGKGKIRSEFLRKNLSIPETGHLLENRAFRNHLEHYDERLDDWVSDWGKNNYPEYFNSISLLGDGQTHDVSTLGLEEMRVFNCSNMRFIFQNESYDLTELVDVIKEISDTITKLGAEYQPKRYLVSLAPVDNGDRQ